MKLFSKKEQPHFLDQYKELIKNVMNNPKLYTNSAVERYCQANLAADYQNVLDIHQAMKRIAALSQKENRSPHPEELGQIEQLAQKAQMHMQSYVQKNICGQLITFPYPTNPELKKEVDLMLKHQHDSSKVLALSDYEMLKRIYDTEAVDVQRTETGKLINDIILYLSESEQANNPHLTLFMCCKNALDNANAASQALAQLSSEQPKVEFTQGTQADVHTQVQDTMGQTMRTTLNRQMYLAQLEAVMHSIEQLAAQLPKSADTDLIDKQLKKIIKSASHEHAEHNKLTSSHRK